MRNFKLGPWIHAASEIDQLERRARRAMRFPRVGRIHDRFDRKGHEFVVVDVMLIANGSRLVQTVRHTAIYRPSLQGLSLVLLGGTMKLPFASLPYCFSACLDLRPIVSTSRTWTKSAASRIRKFRRTGSPS